MDIIKKQIAYNRSARTGGIKYIVIHDTGNPGTGANANAHFNYFNGGNRGSSADFFVDDREVIQVNDYNRYYTWHCGDGKGAYGITNSNSIGIEMCINQDGNYEAAFSKTIELTRHLMQELNIPIDGVVRHYDASRKNCPASMSGNGWAKWKEFTNRLKESEGLTMTQYEELKNEIAELTETVKILATELHDIKNPFIYNYIDDNMPKWAREAVQWAVDNGILVGDENGLNLDDKGLRYIVMMYRRECERSGK